VKILGSLASGDMPPPQLDKKASACEKVSDEAENKAAKVPEDSNASEKPAESRNMLMASIKQSAEGNDEKSNMSDSGDRSALLGALQKNDIIAAGVNAGADIASNSKNEVGDEPPSDQTGSSWVRSKGGRLKRADEQPEESGQEARSSLLSAITDRSSGDTPQLGDVESGQQRPIVNHTSNESSCNGSDARSSLFAAIKEKGDANDSRANAAAVETKDGDKTYPAPQDPRSSLLGAITMRASAGAVGESEAPAASEARSRSSLLSAIQNKDRSKESVEVADNPSSAMLGAIKTRAASDEEKDQITDRFSMMSAIQNRKNKCSEDGKRVNPRSAMLIAIQGRSSSQASDSEDDDALPSASDLVTNRTSSDSSMEAMVNWSPAFDENDRTSLMSAVQNHSSAKGGGQKTEDASKKHPRTAMLGAIQRRAAVSSPGEASAANIADPEEGGRASLMNSIQNRKEKKSTDIEKKDKDPAKAGSSTEDESKPENRSLIEEGANPHTNLMASIQAKGGKKVKAKARHSNANVNPRASMLTAITSRKAPDDSDDVEAESGGELRNSLMASIQARGGKKEKAKRKPRSENADPRASMLGAIASRKAAADSDEGEVESTGDPRNSLMASIKASGGGKDRAKVKHSSESADPRSYLLSAIASHKAQDDSDDGVAESSGEPRNSLKASIQARSSKKETGMVKPSHDSADPRASMLSAIASRKAPDDSDEGEAESSGDPRNSLMASIQAKGDRKVKVNAKPSGENADPRASMMSAIASRKAPDDSDDEGEVVITGDSRDSLMASIQARGSKKETGKTKPSSENADPGESMMSAIASRKAPDDSDHEGEVAITGDSRNSLMASIQARGRKKETGKTTPSSENADPRASMLSAIASRKSQDDSDEGESESSGDPRNSLMASIQARVDRKEKAKVMPRSENADSRASMMSAIASRTAPDDSDEGESESSGDPRNSLMASIQARVDRKEKAKVMPRSENADSRASMTSAIASRTSQDDSDEGEAESSADPRNSWMASIQAKGDRKEKAKVKPRSENADPRASMTSAIASRKAPDDSDDEGEVAITGDPRNSLMASIQARGRKKVKAKAKPSSENADPRASMLSAIASLTSQDDSIEGEAESSGDPHNSLMASIQARAHKKEIDKSTPSGVNADPRASLLSAIASRKDLDDSDAKGQVEISGDPRNSLMASIQARGGKKETGKTKRRSENTDPHASMLSAIASCTARAESNNNDGADYTQQPSVEGSDPRTGLLSAIQNRGKTQTTLSNGVGSVGSRSSLMSAIQNRDRSRKSEDTKSSANSLDHDPQVAILSAIQGRGSAASVHCQTSDTNGQGSRFSLMSAIQNRRRSQTDGAGHSDLAVKPTPQDPRSAVLNAIQNTGDPASADDAAEAAVEEKTDARSSLLSAIQGRRRSQNDETDTKKDEDENGRAETVRKSRNARGAGLLSC
jgi:translation initiation factor 1 (eIF-1/SUI1)